MRLVSLRQLLFHLSKRLILTLPALLLCVSPATSAPHHMVLYDGLPRTAERMAALSHHPVPFVHVVGQVELLGVGKGKDNLDDKDRARIQKIANKWNTSDPGSIVCLDIECWKLTDVSTQQLEENAEKYLTVLKWFKSAAPSLKVGYYGVCPVADFLLRKNKPDRLAHWLEENRYTERVGNAADIVCPSLYTYSDAAEWAWEAETNVRYAKRFHKPVLAFVWPQYETNSYPFKDGQTWLHELQLLDRLGADGAIVWGISGFVVNPQSGWWKSTLLYLSGQD